MERRTIDAARRAARSRARWLAVALAAAFPAICASVQAATEVTSTLGDQIVCATAPVNYNADGNPARVFVEGDFVFVLEQWNARVAVYDLVGKTNLFYFGANFNSKNNINGRDTPGVAYTDSGKWAFGTGEGAFKQPFGMALDTFSGEHRFAVADTGNNRVQLFTFDAASGEITFAAASDAIFSEPNAVAFTAAGDLLVADTGNARVVRLSVSGASLAEGDSYALGEKAYATGICSDSDTSEGFWITDTRNQRVAYYRIADGTDAPAAYLGTSSSQDFVTPRDVQLFGSSGNGTFLCVVDNQGSRVRVVEAVASGGAYTDVVAVGDVGSASDASLQEFQKLWRPNGVFTVPDEKRVYVADYGNNLVKWYTVSPESVDPPEPQKYCNFLSVETFDEAGNPCTTFTNHQTIGLVVTFETDDQIQRASILCDKTGGMTFVAIPNATVSGNTISYDNIANTENMQPYYGTIDLVITANGAEGVYTTNVVAAYTLVESPTPAEEYEEAPWDFTAITVADGAATLTWDFPQENVPASGECTFRIESRTSLTSGNWATLVDDLSATSAVGCTDEVDLSALGNPPSLFFRLFWTNKVKE